MERGSKSGIMGAEGVCAVGVEGSYAMLVYDEEELKGSIVVKQQKANSKGRDNALTLMP